MDMSYRLAALVVLLCAVGCGSEELTDGFTADEWAKVQTMGPMDPEGPKDTTNKYAEDPNAAKLGQQLFFDKSFSGPLIEPDNEKPGGNGKVGERGKIGCVSCHDPSNWMFDNRSPGQTSLGAQYMIRNAASAINMSYYKVWCEKDGIRDSQWSDSLTDPEDPTSMNGSRLLVAHQLYAKYKAEYNAVFTEYQLPKELDPKDTNAARFPPEGKPGDGAAYDKMPAADKLIIDRIYANFGKAIQAYLRKLVSRNAPIDKYVQGDTSALNASQKNGLHLFIGKAACIACHTGPSMTDSKFHDTALGAQGPHVVTTETGRYDGVPAVLGCQYNSNSDFSDDKGSKRLDGVVQDDSQKGQWRTSQLRQVAETAPYMHTGQFKTLEDVLKFYNDGGSASGYVGTRDKLDQKLNLSDAEMGDVVNLLKSFTGEPVAPELLADTSKK